MKRHGLPLRGSVRYLLAKPLARGGHGYHWNPAGRDVKAPGRPDWLRPTSLGRELASAITAAETLNARLDAWRRTGEGGRPGTIAGVITAYLASRRFTGLAERTRHDYRKHLDAIREAMGDARPADVTPPVAARYHDHLLTGGLNQRSADYRIQVLRLFFAWAIRRGYAPSPNPVARPELVASRRAVRTWSPVQLSSAWRHAPPAMRLALALALYTLQRQGDVLAMRWDAWDRSARTLTLTQSKTGKAMVLPVHPRLGAMLRLAHRRRQGPTIVTTATGGRYTDGGFRAIWARVARAVAKEQDKVRPPTFHELRKTGATALATAGATDELVRLWTGHGRRGGDAILDVYVARARDLRAAAWPAMTRWRLGKSERLTTSSRNPLPKHAMRVS